MLAVNRLRDWRFDPNTHPRGRAFLSAASGLVRVQHRLYVSPMTSTPLPIRSQWREAPGRLIRLFEGDLPEDPTRRKAQKPDLEALVQLPARLGCPGARCSGWDRARAPPGIPAWC